MANKSWEEMTLEERNAAEREYQLGKTDIDPATGKTRSQLQKEHEAAVIAMDQDLIARTEKNRADGEEVTRDPAESTSSITAGLPTEAELNDLRKNDLVEQAAREGLDVASVATKAEIIEQILAARGGGLPALPDRELSEDDSSQPA